MNNFKVILVVAVTILSFSAANAQTSKKLSKTTTAKSAMRYQCPMKCEGDKTYQKNGKCPVCKMQMKAVAATAVTYQCPMKCEGDKVYAKAGKCPVCKMTLAKMGTKKAVDNHEGHDHN